MELKEKKQETMVTIPEKDLLSLVAAKLKGRVLFPKKHEEAKKFLETISRPTT